MVKTDLMDVIEEVLKNSDFPSTLISKDIKSLCRPLLVEFKAYFKGREFCGGSIRDHQVIVILERSLFFSASSVVAVL